MLEKEVDAFVECALQKQKEIFHSDVESFASFSQKLDKEIRNYCTRFHQQFYSGYRVLCTYMEQQKQCVPCIAQDKWERLHDTEYVLQCFEEGKVLYEIFGLSFETVLHCYTAATALIEEKRLEDARNALFFLTTIAPQVPEFWIAQSSVHILIHEYHEAIIAGQEALDLAPENVEAHYALLRAYIANNDCAHARTLCEESLAHARQEKNQALVDALHSAQEYIAQHDRR